MHNINTTNTTTKHHHHPRSLLQKSSPCEDSIPHLALIPSFQSPTCPLANRRRRNLTPCHLPRKQFMRRSSKDGYFMESEMEFGQKATVWKREKGKVAVVSTKGKGLRLESRKQTSKDYRLGLNWKHSREVYSAAVKKRLGATTGSWVGFFFLSKLLVQVVEDDFSLISNKKKKKSKNSISNEARIIGSNIFKDVSYLWWFRERMYVLAELWKYE
ncbi:hypothetical protein M5K25_002962 [Dendrobium thyrsiflorum]|uniref:Uncharacterized protein n=1 Tax=Dendrobium thyrsiflorum TaxID=117978 RepID=A0ABD0VPY8_DENTH